MTSNLQICRCSVTGWTGSTGCPSPGKKLIYYLSEAALAGRDILWDQNGKYNLRIRKTLETLYTDNPGDRNSSDFRALAVYLKRVWFANGIHHHYGCGSSNRNSARPSSGKPCGTSPADKLPLEEGQTAEELCDLLVPVIFDPEVMSKRVNQADGDDLVRTSACNYYGDGVTQTEAETFYNAMKQEGDPHPVMYGMNSRLVKADGNLQEKVWKSGGLYGAAIDRIIYWLEKATGVAENGNRPRCSANSSNFTAPAT